MSRVAFAVAAAAAAAVLAASPRPPSLSFPPTSQVALANGAVVVSQPVEGASLIGAQLFAPAGLAQQTLGNAGIAALSASVVLRTPVEGSTSLADVATALGASVTFTLDPQDTRYYVECRPSDFPRLLHDLFAALARPDPAGFEPERNRLRQAADETAKNPVALAYMMVRQVHYKNTGFAFGDGGRATSLARLTPADVAAFAARYLHGAGTVLALAGAVTQATVDAATSELSRLPAERAVVVARPPPVDRQHQIVAQRTVSAQWVAIGYSAPTMFASDFPAMLVIEALLGRGGDVHALSYGSQLATPDEYVGAYYQYEADPGSLVVFLSSTSGNIDQSIRELETGITRLRDKPLPAELVARAKQTAVGDFYTSITSLSDESWLLGRAAQSPAGVGFENELPLRIAAVSPADVLRVAKSYLARETIAVVQPQSTGR